MPDDAVLQAVAAHWDGRAATFDAEPDHGLNDKAVRSAWKARLRSWLPPAPAHVIDLGCGTGSLAVLLAEEGYRVTGVDLSAEMVALARQKATLAGVSASFVQMDAGNPALQPAAFDVVLVRHLVWTLPDPHGALRRWTRLLRAGSRLILVEGRWGPPGGATDHGDYEEIRRALPWYGGLPATALADAVRPLAARVHIEDLAGDAGLWGQLVNDERYAVIADC